MRGLVLLMMLAVISSLGCKNSPKRELRQPHVEEFAVPPASYNMPPEYPRDDKALMPKSSQPFNVQGIGQGGGVGGPGGAGGMAPRR